MNGSLLANPTIQFPDFLELFPRDSRTICPRFETFGIFCPVEIIKRPNKLPVEISYKPFVESLEQIVEVSFMKTIQAHEIARIKHLWEQKTTTKENFRDIKWLMPKPI